MSVYDAYLESKPGFSFENSARNAAMGDAVKMAAFKTGTTIAGVVYKDGVVLGADTRATGGTTVVDKNCAKIHYIAPNIYCCGAGTAADTEYVTNLISSRLDLHRLSTGRESRVKTAVTMLKQHLFNYQGHVSAALVLGGVDFTGARLYTVAPHGSTDHLPYVTMGSGSLAAMAVFEAGYKENMSEEEAVKLVHGAISSGIFNDLGSGSNVDITIIRRGEVDVRRNMDKPNDRVYKSDKLYNYPIGTTPVVSESVTKSNLRAFTAIDTTPMDL
eukprot:comp20102_c0_seq1/m.39577 comp20102_c0_seq1/g.39577  ORF comp20102_c0_seq1/g.39577 comp20102_c0_seq1/m.39577 type:complete len:273 (-) comp20102_c0_seq1:93-911(-)